MIKQGEDHLQSLLKKLPTFAEKIEQGLTKNSYSYKTLKNDTVNHKLFQTRY